MMLGSLGSTRIENATDVLTPLPDAPATDVHVVPAPAVALVVCHTLSTPIPATLTHASAAFVGLNATPEVNAAGNAKLAGLTAGRLPVMFCQLPPALVHTAPMLLVVKMVPTVLGV